MTITTPITELFGIQHPILLAGMNVASGPHLAAAVSNAGGLGVIGGMGYSPEMLREQIKEIKAHLKPGVTKFGVDLLLPQVGGNARKTNYDYTHGQLPELIKVVIEEGTGLFVSAVGVPPKEAVDQLHKAGIPVMNMIGAPKHVKRALAAGVDIICAQGGEGGGHTGSIPTSILIPAVAAEVKGKKSPLTGKPIEVIAAGGISNGKSLAAALMCGASAVWVGTRFICAEEAGAPKGHQDAVMECSYDGTFRTIIYTGRPLRIKKNPYALDWENNRQLEIKTLTSEGKIPVPWEIEQYEQSGKDVPEMIEEYGFPYLMGEVAALVKDVKPAKAIVDEMVSEAEQSLTRGLKLIKAKL
ncbi:2-nitropropane dioxygenase [Kockiozyma suomiensis]|uniref:2-nitropropane dioxygenase n=1 Tax=Kockiozyma suomiensis TaxID=1337062 RepID=UPI003343AB90